MMSKIKQQGYQWNHKRVYRVYCEMRLNLRVKPKKRISSREKVYLLQPIQPNICWSIDFMSDVLRHGSRFRTFNVIDDYNREALLIEPSTSFPASYVIRLLDQLSDTRGYPKSIRLDNGPELISKKFKQWADQHGIVLLYIQPGKPAQNGFVERFNRTYREEVLDLHLFENLNEVSAVTTQWINKYNNDRPHESLGNQSPMVFATTKSQQKCAVVR